MSKDKRARNARQLLQDRPEICSIIDEKVSQGVLGSQDIGEIMCVIEAEQEKRQLTTQEIRSIDTLMKDGLAKNDKAPVSKRLKILGGILCIGGLVILTNGIVTFVQMIGAILNGEYSDLASVSIMFLVLYGIAILATFVIAITVGIRLLRGRRRFAAVLFRTLVIFDIACLVLDVLVYGVTSTLLFYAIDIGIVVALMLAIDPSLHYERKLKDRIIKLDTRVRAEKGNLGLDLSGKGYINLDFFNLFWVFVVCGILGLIIEDIYHVTVVDPGVYQDRAGLLFGPFSPIYGFGGVLMTLALNRHRGKNIILLFVICTIIGGAFEYFVSAFMEYGFGAIAWDYSGQFLSINGRTCLLFASMFGFVGTFWIKLLLPITLFLVNKIPWKIRYIVTFIFAAFMIVNCVLTLQALDCWYCRLSGKPPVTPVEVFCQEHFPNDWMQDRFQSMTIMPQGGHM